jgi:hypothetical protein
MASGGIVLRWKLDGNDVAGDESALIRTFLIIDGNSWIS